MPIFNPCFVLTFFHEVVFTFRLVPRYVWGILDSSNSLSADVPALAPGVTFLSQQAKDSLVSSSEVQIYRIAAGPRALA